jgi:hypothetical protein
MMHPLSSVHLGVIRLAEWALDRIGLFLVMWALFSAASLFIVWALSKGSND